MYIETQRTKNDQKRSTLRRKTRLKDLLYWVLRIEFGIIIRSMEQNRRPIKRHPLYGHLTYSQCGSAQQWETNDFFAKRW